MTFFNILKKIIRQIHPQAVAGLGVGGVFVLTLVPQTLGLERYRRLIAQYQDGKEQPLSADVLKQTEQVLDNVLLAPQEEASLEFFTCVGNDPVHNGSVKLRTGAIIGLPATFSYHQVDQVDRDKIQLNRESIDWESAAGRLLVPSLVLSDNAKLFAIAREVHYANTHHVWVDGFLKAGFIVVAYTTGFFANQLLHLKRIMKPWGRGGLYSVIALGYYFLYLTSADTYYCYRDNKVDRKSALIGRNYAVGGVEYYNKILQRNQAIRTLMGGEGQKLYTPYGNNVASWRRPQVQLTVRRDNLTKYLRNYENEQTPFTS